MIRAFETAQAKGIRCIGILGGEGGGVRSLSDLSIVVPSHEPQHIQEVQIVVIHLLCELVESWIVQRESQHKTTQKDQRIEVRNTKLPLMIN